MSDNSMDADAYAQKIKTLQGNVLKRMSKAHEEGRGVRISAEEIQALSVTIMGEWWGNLTEDGGSSL